MTIKIELKLIAISKLLFFDNNERNLKGVIRREVKCIIIDTRDLVSTLVNYQASYYKVITSLKYIK